MKLKLEVYNAWGSGRRERILELARERPDLIQVMVDVGTVRRDFPAGVSAAFVKLQRCGQSWPKLLPKSPELKIP